MKKCTKILPRLILSFIILAMIIGVNMIAWAEKKYRYYTLYNYLGTEVLISAQTAISLALKEHPELKEISTADVTPLPKMTDQRGEYYKKDAKTGPAIYFRTLQDMPNNYFNATQVLIGAKNGFEGCEEHQNINYGMIIANEKVCILLDVHSYVQTQPLILQAIKDALNHPSKYVTKENYDVWFDYVWQMVSWSNGELLLSQPPFQSSIEKTKQEMKQKYLNTINSGTLLISNTFGKDKKQYPNLYILRFINNEGKVTHIEYFEPYLTQGK